jgi:hypothetical protein
VTAEKADWAYVLNAWGGVTPGEPVVSEETVEVPLELGGISKPTRLDSAICACSASATVDTDYARVRISLMKCVCGSKARGELSVGLSRSIQGTYQYQVVYDDSAAGYPYLGRLVIPSAEEDQRVVDVRAMQMSPETSKRFDELIRPVDVWSGETLVATSEHGPNQNLIPSNKKNQISPETTVRGALNILGPGYISSISGTGGVEWFFDDGTSIRYSFWTEVDLIPCWKWNPPLIGEPTVCP